MAYLLWAKWRNSTFLLNALFVKYVAEYHSFETQFLKNQVLHKT